MEKYHVYILLVSIVSTEILLCTQTQPIVLEMGPNSPNGSIARHLSRKEFLWISRDF